MRFCRALACLVVAMLLAPSGRAFALDYTDLWFNPSEPGWGVNVVQSGDLLFLTFFVYGADRRPTWYAAQLSRDTSGDFDGFLGFVYAGTGTAFTSAWDAQAFAVAPVGTASFQP